MQHHSVSGSNRILSIFALTSCNQIKISTSRSSGILYALFPDSVLLNLDAIPCRQAEVVFGPALKPALIILDVTMPKEKGLQMYRELKEDEDLENIPVIMVSTIDKKTFSFYQRFQSTSRHKGLPDPGAYLEKPLEAEELIKLVRTLTGTDECPLAEDDD